MTSRLSVLVVAALVALMLKHHYAVASADDLRWMLQPTALLTGAATGTRFVATPGEGYLSHERLFLIEKSCAGVNFMLAAFGMLVCARLWRVNSGGAGIVLLAASLLVSYPAAVLVNTVRITIAMWVAEHPAVWAGLDAGEIHRLEGVVVYFGGLVLLYELTQRSIGSAAALGRSET